MPAQDGAGRDDEPHRGKAVYRQLSVPASSASHARSGQLQAHKPKIIPLPAVQDRPGACPMLDRALQGPLPR